MHRWQLIRIHLQLLFTAMVWGGQFVVLRFILRELGPFEVLLLRTLLAASFYLVLLIGLVLRRGSLPRITKADWRLMPLVALLGIPGGGFGMITAQRYITADVASLITVIGPIFTALAAYLLLGQRLRMSQLFGIALAICGFLLILLFGGKGARFEVSNMLGVLLMVSSPFLWAFYTVLSKSLVMRYGSTIVTGLAMLIGLLYLLPIFSGNFITHLRAMSGTAWAAALFSGLIATGISYLLWNQGLLILQPAQVAVYIYLVPVFGIITAAIVLGTRPTLWALLGGLTIFAGVIVTNLGARRGPIDPEPLPVDNAEQLLISR